jgi:type I restriction enzyme, R subunit
VLAKLRGIFAIDWQRTTQARARVREAIEETLDEGLPRAYSPEVFKTKATVIFQHVYERYGRAA